MLPLAVTSGDVVAAAACSTDGELVDSCVDAGKEVAPADAEEGAAPGEAPAVDEEGEEDEGEGEEVDGVGGCCCCCCCCCCSFSFLVWVFF